MAAKITPSLRASIERLKHAGAVNGLCLGWRRQVLVNLLPFGEFRAERVLHMLIDAREHFTGGGRAVETLWFGYEGVHLLAMFISHLRSLHRKSETGDTNKRMKRSRIALIILGTILGLGIVATAIAVPVSLLTGQTTTAPIDRTTGKSIA